MSRCQQRQLRVAREGTAAGETIQGGNADDTIFGHGGNDTLKGKSGDDRLYGGAGDDDLRGQKGDDILYGEDGDDTLIGHGGKDILYGGTGNDTLDGGTGNDILVWDSIDTAIDGGTGTDTLRVDSGDVDLTAFAGTINGIEQIDLETDAGANAVALTASDVLDMSDTDILIINGELGDSLAAGTGWTGGAPVGATPTPRVCRSCSSIPTLPSMRTYSHDAI